MNQSKFLLIVAFLFSISFVSAQENAEPTGFDGDNFSLEGALEMFKTSESLEDFEKKLNIQDNNVNNLDLNQDEKTDYVMVRDNKEGDLHAIVLQVALNKSETQDIAVIEIEKTSKEEAILQIIGDEDVFGDQSIVEPFDVEANDEGKGPSADMEFTRIVVNVWFWPCVRHVYHPHYSVWISPWSWNYYPHWWSPWRPLSWHVFHPLRIRHHHHYHRVTTHRVVHAHRIYTPKRKTSATVVNRTKVTRTKVGIRDKGGKTVGGKKTTTETSVTGPRGNKVTKKETTTKIGARENTMPEGKKAKSVEKVSKKPEGKKVAGKKTTTTKKLSKKPKSGATKKAGKKTSKKPRRKNG